MKTEERAKYPVYIREVPRWWWLETTPFRRFVLRELTSVFVALFSIILLLFLFALSRGQDHYQGFLHWLDLPLVAVLNVVTLVAVLYHTVTSIQLASQIQEVRFGGRTVPRSTVMIALTAGWIVLSAVLVYVHVDL